MQTCNPFEKPSIPPLYNNLPIDQKLSSDITFLLLSRPEIYHLAPPFLLVYRPEIYHLAPLLLLLYCPEVYHLAPVTVVLSPRNLSSSAILPVAISPRHLSSIGTLSVALSQLNRCCYKTSYHLAPFFSFLSPAIH